MRLTYPITEQQAALWFKRIVSNLVLRDGWGQMRFDTYSSPSRIQLRGGDDFELGYIETAQLEAVIREFGEGKEA